MSQYIGKTISLISVTDNRYVGLLENIDSEKGTVTLKSVRCFGTEGRKNWGPEEIYPNSMVYQNVQFNGNDVKDLNILEVSLDEVQPVLRPDNNSSQTQQQGGIQQQPPQQTTINEKQSQESEAPREKLPAAVTGYGVYAPAEGTIPVDIASNNTEPVKEGTQRNRGSNRPNFGDNHQNNNRRQQQNRKIEIPDDDFDFSSNNAKFAKEAPEGHINEEIEEVNAANGNENQHDGFYDKKSSFFDSISTSAEENTNMRWQEEKVLNMDTFGQSSARPRFNNRRGNFRGRGRGRGRGNFRGGNRGGNRNYQNNNDYRNSGSDNYQSKFSNNTQVEF